MVLGEQQVAQFVCDGRAKHDRSGAAIVGGNFVDPIDHHKRQPAASLAAAWGVAHRIWSAASGFL